MGSGEKVGVSRQLGRAQRLAAAVSRQAGRCVWCGRTFGPLVPPTTDHLVPRIKGGPSWLENEVAACQRCNAERGHRSPTDWLTECDARDWESDRRLVLAVLRGLATRIATEGGQRRARQYLAGQLRRLTG